MDGRLVGHACVSINGQELALQVDALKKVACKEDLICTDKVRGANSERPGLDACLET